MTINQHREKKLDYCYYLPHAIWLGMIAVSLACASTGGSSAIDTGEKTSPPSGTTRSPAGATPEPDDIFPLPPDPVTVHAVLDKEQSFSSKIGVYPGVASISTVDGETSSGIGLYLSLGEILLSRDADGMQTPAFGTPVIVTPVSEIPDIPFSRGFLAAFHFSPEGLVMTEPGWLSITLPGEYTPEELVGFAADGTGEDFHLFPIDPYSFDGTKTINFSIMHFSLYGVAQATLQEIETQHNRPPARPEGQDENELAPLIPLETEDDLAPLVPVTADTKNQKKLRKSYNRTAKPYMEKLGSLDCNKVGVAAYEYQKWTGRVDKAGEVNRFSEKIVSDGEALLKRLLECVKINCPNCSGGKANQKSVDEFLVLTSWGETLSRSLGADAEFAYWRALANLCAEQAGIPFPHPGGAGDCMGAGCDATPTPLKCP